MPFIQRIVEPKYLSRTSLWDVDGNPRVTDDELEAVTNNTLSNALRQLASLVLAANDIFAELRAELRGIAQRSEKLKSRIDFVEDSLAAYDPKKVTVRKYFVLLFRFVCFSRRPSAKKQEGGDPRFLSLPVEDKKEKNRRGWNTDLESLNERAPLPGVIFFLFFWFARFLCFDVVALVLLLLLLPWTVRDRALMGKVTEKLFGGQVRTRFEFVGKEEIKKVN